MKKIVCFVILFTAGAVFVDGYNIDGGYSNGFMGDCPGSEKPVVITEKSLKKLTFTVQGPGNLFKSRRTKYNYYQMKELSQNQDIDFVNRKTVIYFVGYMDSPEFAQNWPLIKTYMDFKYNILILDTGYFSRHEYPKAARYIRAAGHKAGEMLANLTKYGLDLKNTEGIGLSLGAHTMSFAAKNFQAITGKNISTLIGVEPSGPCFRNRGPEDRLDKSDADFVQVISTNIDGYGIAVPSGHVHFYVNGGEFQTAAVKEIPCEFLCSHFRAYFLWITSMYHPKSFIGMQCDTVQQARDRRCYDRIPQVTNTLGPQVNRSRPGIFYLSTSNEYPYYLGKKGLVEENDVYVNEFLDYNKEDLVQI